MALVEVGLGLHPAIGKKTANDKVAYTQCSTVHNILYTLLQLIQTVSK